MIFIPFFHIKKYCVHRPHDPERSWRRCSRWSLEPETGADPVPHTLGGLLIGRGDRRALLVGSGERTQDVGVGRRGHLEIAVRRGRLAETGLTEFPGVGHRGTISGASE